MPRRYDFSVPNDQISYRIHYRADKTVLDTNGTEKAGADVLADIKLPEGTYVDGTDIGGFTVTRFAYFDYDLMQPYARRDELNEGRSAFYFNRTEEMITARLLDEEGQVVKSVEVHADALATAIDKAYGDHVRAEWVNVPAEIATIGVEAIELELPDGRTASLPADDAMYVHENEERGQIGIKLANDKRFSLSDGQKINIADLRATLKRKKDNNFLNLPYSFIKQVERPAEAKGPRRFVLTMPKGMKVNDFDIGGFKIELSEDDARFFDHKETNSASILMKPDAEMRLYKFNRDTGQRNYLPKTLTFMQVATSRKENIDEYHRNQADATEKTPVNRDENEKQVAIKKAEAQNKNAIGNITQTRTA
jgi:hypothetical protein